MLSPPVQPACAARLFSPCVRVPVPTTLCVACVSCIMHPPYSLSSSLRQMRVLCSRLFKHMQPVQPIQSVQYMPPAQPSRHMQPVYDKLECTKVKAELLTSISRSSL
jgi:hypothetical protein